jgi:hypothetical protein
MRDGCEPNLWDYNSNKGRIELGSFCVSTLPDETAQGQDRKLILSQQGLLSGKMMKMIQIATRKIVQDSLRTCIKNPGDKRVRVGTISGRGDVPFIKMGDGARVTLSRMEDIICFRNNFNG